jgi:hypothetical protein
VIKKIFLLTLVFGIGFVYGKTVIGKGEGGAETENDACFQAKIGAIYSAIENAYGIEASSQFEQSDNISNLKIVETSEGELQLVGEWEEKSAVLPFGIVECNMSATFQFEGNSTTPQLEEEKKEVKKVEKPSTERDKYISLSFGVGGVTSSANTKQEYLEKEGMAQFYSVSVGVINGNIRTGLEYSFYNSTAPSSEIFPSYHGFGLKLLGFLNEGKTPLYWTSGVQALQSTSDVPNTKEIVKASGVGFNIGAGLLLQFFKDLEITLGIDYRTHYFEVNSYCFSSDGDSCESVDITNRILLGQIGINYLF